MRIISWNVNGIRAIHRNGYMDNLQNLQADILCLQETKATAAQVQEALFGTGYHVFANEAEKKGYSGTAILTRTQPDNVMLGMGHPDHDKEGRIVTASYPAFYVVSVYTPNASEGLRRLPYRQQWDADFRQYISGLAASKPVLVCGDLNVAHQPIDIARPRENYNKSAGYTQVEIDGISSLLGSGLTDSFRQHHPDTVKYSWWSFRANARANNIGWRIDYVLASNPLVPAIRESFILNEVTGSDHCPVGVHLQL